MHDIKADTASQSKHTHEARDRARVPLEAHHRRVVVYLSLLFAVVLRVWSLPQEVGVWNLEPDLQLTSPPSRDDVIHSAVYTPPPSRYRARMRIYSSAISSAATRLGSVT